MQKTILEVLNATTEFFKKRGVPDAKYDAQVLLAHGLGMDRMALFLNFDRPLSDAELAHLRPLVKRRAAREPLQHIVGHTSFRGHPIFCGPQALIPRPETELICDITKEFSSPICEVGTGTGAIAIAFAKERGCQVDAVDISEDALALAKKNALENGVQDLVQFFCGDLMEGLPTGKQYGALVANLPYIPDADLKMLEPEVADFDPHLALFGGADGLDVIRRLLKNASPHLLDGAPVVLEIASGQETALQAATEAGEFPGLQWVGVHKDFAGKPRFVELRSSKS
jgi:release factor glutamine methyltransferase